MRALAAAIFAAVVADAQLAGADLKIDHATIAVDDLAAFRAKFAAAGIPTDFGGKHSNGQTEMALSSFPDGSYLELIAPQPGADVSSHYWAPFMRNNAGPCAWAIATANLAADVARLRSAGISIKEQKSGRLRPDGVELKWETASVGPGAPGSFYPFLIHDETPRDRRVYPQGKPTTTKISGIRFVVVGVRDLPGAIAKYRAAFELGEPEMQDDTAFGARLAYFRGSPVILAAPRGKNSWLMQRLKQFGDAPCAFVLGSREPWPGKSTKWFSYTVRWIDPARLGGMRIGVTQE